MFISAVHLFSFAAFRLNKITLQKMHPEYSIPGVHCKITVCDFSVSAGTSLNAAHLREEDDVTDRLCSGESHYQTVDADAHAAGRRHSVFQRGEEVLIDFI